MKQETYDVPAYKFSIGILDYAESYRMNDREYETALDRSLREGKIIMIPWENFDGLTVREVLMLLNRKAFAFISHVSWQNNKVYSIEGMQVINFKCNFSTSLLISNEEKQLDKWIEEIMEKKYNNSNENTQRVMRCFFERYQDRSYEETKERIKRLHK